MTDEQDKALQEVLTALSWYANSNIYWGKPIPLEMNLDPRTLKVAHEHKEASEIMQDRGELARNALFEFEGVFKCTYVYRTEI